MVNFCQECCRIDDLLPSVLVFSFSPGSVNSEVLGLDVLLSFFQSPVVPGRPAGLLQVAAGQSAAAVMQW